MQRFHLIVARLHAAPSLEGSPATLRDLEPLDHDTAQTSGGEREDQIRRASIEAITQATAVAKANRALRAPTSADGSRMYREGDMVDYRRPTTTKDDHGGWNGPYPVVRNKPDRGQLVVRARSREINVQYPDA